MSQETIIANSEVSFKDFLFKNKRNRTILWLAAAAIVIQFAVFKYFYPFASYIHGDSFSYIKAADFNLDINTYLIGYSKFLRLFSVFSKSDNILTLFQYISIQFSALYLLFTIFFFYKTTKFVQILIILFFVFNPLLLHLGNLISSDCIFVALSLTWFSLLLWIINKPSRNIITLQLVILFIAFTFRYNALIYPLFAAIAFGLSNLPKRNKIIGIGLGILLCGLFVIHTGNKYKQLTGQWQYSPFSGWQFANNAMYAYRYVEKENREDVPNKYKKLDDMIRAFFDSTRDTNRYPTEAIQASTFYMWTPNMPLMKYKNISFKNDTTIPELKKWASMGPLYKSYGLYIITKYPYHFIKYFIWPNTLKYYAPPLEFMEKYNSGKKDVNEQTKIWFRYNSRILNTRTSNNKAWALEIFPILSGVINFALLLTLISFLLLKGWTMNETFTKAVIIGATFWIINALFTITASSAALRFQSFPLLFNTIIMALIIDWMVQLLKTNSTNHSPIAIHSPA